MLAIGIKVATAVDGVKENDPVEDVKV